MKYSEIDFTLDELKGFGNQLADIVDTIELYQQLIDALSIIGDDKGDRYKVYLIDRFLSKQHDMNQGILKTIDHISTCLMEADNRDRM